MSADIFKPMPKPGMDIKQGIDMKPMLTDLQDKTIAMKSSGNMDVDFAVTVRVHHQSATIMAEAELQNGKDPQMRAMAKGIIRTQKEEICRFWQVSGQTRRCWRADGRASDADKNSACTDASRIYVERYVTHRVVYALSADCGV